MPTLKNCASANCYNYAKDGRFCPKCKSRNYRQNNPLRHAYTNLAAHARERGITFSLTFEHFKEFCNKTSYLTLRGIGKNDLTIDRIDPALGYADGNIQALTNAENKKKDLRERKGWGSGSSFYANKTYGRRAA